MDEANLKRAHAWNDHKEKLMAACLGQLHEISTHAIVAYEVGGALDLFYYSGKVPGTAVVTMELSDFPNVGPSNREFGCYELVMFTKHAFEPELPFDERAPFEKVRTSISQVLNAIAPFSEHASLNSGETCEFPIDERPVSGRSLIFDAFACYSDDVVDRFGLLTIVEVFRSEMNFARSKGTNALIKRLKKRGHWPYSDMDREPVA